MHSQWRDVAAWAKTGAPLSTTSDESAKMYDAALTQFMGYYEDRETDGLGGAIHRCLQADENCIMGHVMANVYEFLTLTCGAFDDPSKAHVGEMVLKAQAPSVTDRERHHVRATQLLADGHFQRACLVWEEILARNPLDSLALRMAHECCLLLGAREKLRDIPARVLGFWEKSCKSCDSLLPHAAAVRALYALGLAESRQFEEARDEAKRALEANAREPMAVHAFGLACYYQGRLTEGIEFMRSRSEEWKSAPALVVRNFWLLGLLMLENGDVGAAVSIYDEEILPRIIESMVVVDCNEAANLLFRLCLEGQDVGDRWRELYNLGFVHRDEHVHAAVDVHVMMSTLMVTGDAGAGAAAEAQDLVCSQKFYSRNGTGDNVASTAEVGVAVSEALISWAAGDLVAAWETLWPIRYELHRLGFSRLHQDVFDVFLICVGIQSSKAEDTAMVRLLLEERKRSMGLTPFVEKYHLNILSVGADRGLIR